MPAVLSTSTFFFIHFSFPVHGGCPQRRQDACAFRSLSYGAAYGTPKLGCCGATHKEKVLCDPSGATAQACIQPAYTSPFGHVTNDTAIGISWWDCEATCRADKDCLVWSFQPARIEESKQPIPATCQLVVEPADCATAYCPLAGAVSGSKDCEAAIVAALSVSLRVQSGGFSDGNMVRFFVNGAQLALDTCTGINIVTLWPNATPQAFRIFNTHQPARAGALVTFLTGLDKGTVVMLAVQDEAQAELTDAAKAAIELCGATEIRSLTYRGSYALIGTKGGIKLAEERRSESWGLADTRSVAFMLPAPGSGHTIRVVSAGYQNENFTGMAEFYLDNVRLPVETGRGLNLVVLSKIGTFSTSMTFDTHEPGAVGPLVAFLGSLPLGTPVLVAAQDSADAALTAAARGAIEECGAMMTGGIGYRSSYALIGVKGGIALAEELKAYAQGAVEAMAVYEPHATTTATLPATTTMIPLCTDYSCPLDKALRLDATSLRTTDPAECCEDIPDDVVSIMVKSAGWGSGNLAEFYLKGERLNFEPMRGLNVVVLRADGQPEHVGHRRPQTFDTNLPGKPADSLATYLDNLNNGTVVLLAAMDDAWGGLTLTAMAAIARCGGRKIFGLRWRASYAFVGVKGGHALAEVLRLAEEGVPAVAVARHIVHLSAEDKPVCEGHTSNPPVLGWSVNNQLELEAGCRYELWEGANTASCLDGSWIVVVGGSNTVLMAVQLANMLAPEAIMPVRDGATMGGFTVVDVIVRGGSVVYREAAKLENCTALPYDALCKAAIAHLVEQAPAYDTTAGGTRITLFEARFWDHADVALRTVMDDTRWSAAPMGIMMQVSAWYIYCAAMKLDWCPRANLKDPELTHSKALALFETDMSKVVSKLEALCIAGGRAEKHGCMVGTSSWQAPAADRRQYYKDYNAAIFQGLQGKASAILRIIDLWTLGQAFPHENILGHGSPLLNLWNWQIMLGGMCPPELAAKGSFAEFTGTLCFGELAKRKRVSLNPEKFDLTPATGTRCPHYWSSCPKYGGGHVRCEPWECASSVPCALTAVTRDRVEANLTGACYDPIACSFGGRAPSVARGERPLCHRRIWCDAGLQFVPPLVAVLLVLSFLGVSRLWQEHAPERLKDMRLWCASKGTAKKALSSKHSGVAEEACTLAAASESRAQEPVAECNLEQAVSTGRPAEALWVPPLHLAVATECSRVPWVSPTRGSRMIMNRDGDEDEIDLEAPVIVRGCLRKLDSPINPEPSHTGNRPIVSCHMQLHSIWSLQAVVAGNRDVALPADRANSLQASKDSSNSPSTSVPDTGGQLTGFDANSPSATHPSAEGQLAKVQKPAAVEDTANVAKMPKGAGNKIPLGLARFCASTHIVLGHLYAKGDVVPNSYFFGWGFTWVPWFFMLSGFVLFTAHLQRPKEEGILEYVARRSVTIYPLYAVSLIPAFAIDKASDISPSVVVLFAQTWLLQAWVPTWTENALQMHCWFLSAMVVYWFLMRPLSKWLKDFSLRSTVGLALALFSLPWLVVILPAIMNQSATWYAEHTLRSMDTWLDLAVIFLKYSPACYLHVFVLGMLLAKLRSLLDSRAATAAKPHRWRLLVECMAPAGYCGLLLVFFWEDARPWGYALSARLSVLLPLQAAVLFGLAGLPSLPQGWLAFCMSKLDFLENYSYAVYVFQFICYSVWPKERHINLPLFLIFLYATAVFVVHTVQRPMQTWWGKHQLARWFIPVVLSLTLGGLEAFLPHPELNTDLPEKVVHDSRMVDVRLPLTSKQSNSGSLMNPSLLIKDGKVIVAVRRHRLASRRRIDDGTCWKHGASGCTIIDNIWHSEILIGDAPFDAEAWAKWPTTGEAPFRAEVAAWSALRTPGGQPWVDLCVAETYISSNHTLIRHVVTGPEDPKLVALQSGAVVVIFDSLPPKGADGCSAATDLAPVAQMYLAEYSHDPARAVGRRIDYGSKITAEKNWIPFVTDESEGLFFAYKPAPHAIIACQMNDTLTCEQRHSNFFRPLQLFQRQNPRLAQWHGSAQAVLIKDKERRTPNFPRNHYLALLHAVDLKTKRYAHFAYRFEAEAPYAMLQVSEQLPLQRAAPHSNAAPFAFASGLSVQGDAVVISYGAGDRDARALVLTLDRLDELFACRESAAVSENATIGTATQTLRPSPPR